MKECLQIFSLKKLFGFFDIRLLPFSVDRIFSRASFCFLYKGLFDSRRKDSSLRIARQKQYVALVFRTKSIERIEAAPKNSVTATTGASVRGYKNVAESFFADIDNTEKKSLLKNIKMSILPNVGNRAGEKERTVSFYKKLEMPSFSNGHEIPL